MVCAGTRAARVLARCEMSTMSATAAVNIALVGICGYGSSYLIALLDHHAGNGGANGNGNGGTPFKIVGVVDPEASRSPRLGEIRDRGIPVHADVSGLYATTAVQLTI